MHKEFLQALDGVLPKSSIIKTPAALRPFLLEQRGVYASYASLVIQPTTPQQVAEVLGIASQMGVPIVTQGGNTGLVGGAVAQAEEVILSTKKLSKVTELDPRARTITVEAGVPLKKVAAACARKRLVFPVDLPSRERATVGGIVATNAGGLSSVKYGQAGRNLLGLEVALASGKLVSDLNKLSKRNIGPDCKQIFVGSEGLLGVVTAATFRLYSKPSHQVSVLFSAHNFSHFIKTLEEFKTQFEGQISAFELMNQTSVSLSLSYKEEFFPLKVKSPWYGLVLIDFYRGEPQASLDTVAQFLRSAHSLALVEEFYLSLNNSVWQIRDNIPQAQSAYGASIKHDIAVPLSQMQALVSKVMHIAHKLDYTIKPVIFGHAADESLHFNFATKLKGTPLDNLRLELKEAVTSLVMECGGNFSSEHGIGLVNQELLEKYYVNNQVYMLQSFKKCLDPRNILNPKKLIS